MKYNKYMIYIKKYFYYFINLLIQFIFSNYDNDAICDSNNIHGSHSQYEKDAYDKTNLSWFRWNRPNMKL
jgi:hypothetical protein